MKEQRIKSLEARLRMLQKQRDAVKQQSHKRKLTVWIMKVDGDLMHLKRWYERVNR